MRTILKKGLTFLFITVFFQAQCWAASAPYYNSSLLANSAGHDFVSGAQAGDVLIKVNLWGAVHKPGIHRVPSKTDLLTLMSYAGGPKGNAILDEVTIKRDVGRAKKLIKVDLGELVQGASHHHIELAPNDVIVVPESKPTISQDTFMIVSIASLVLTTILTGVLIDQNQKN